jgi:hypothetical protein
MIWEGSIRIHFGELDVNLLIGRWLIQLPETSLIIINLWPVWSVYCENGCLHTRRHRNLKFRIYIVSFLRSAAWAKHESPDLTGGGTYDLLSYGAFTTNVVEYLLQETKRAAWATLRMQFNHIHFHYSISHHFGTRLIKSPQCYVEWRSCCRTRNCVPFSKLSNNSCSRVCRTWTRTRYAI